MKIKDTTQILREDVNLTEAVRRNTEELPSLSAGLNERLMSQLAADADRKQPARKKVWLYAAIVSAVAACVALLLILKTPTSEPEKNTSDRKAPVASVPESVPEAAKPSDSLSVSDPIVPQELDKDRVQPLLAAENVAKPAEIIPSTPVGRQTKKVSKTVPIVKKEQPPVGETPASEIMDNQSEEYADTLGSSIFQSPENVLLAMQMLAGCEHVIQQETQRMRNNLIEASFEVMPPSKETILVKDENGDLNLLDTRYQRTIEL